MFPPSFEHSSVRAFSDLLQDLVQVHAVGEESAASPSEPTRSKPWIQSARVFAPLR